MTFDDLIRVIDCCDDHTSVTLATGGRFVRRLPGQGHLAFLHYLPAPAHDAVLQEVEGKLGRAIPSEFRAFLAHSNGPDLFDKHLSFFGAEDRISRSLKLEDQIAISLLFDNERFSLAYSDRWAAGWMRIGAISGWSIQHELHASAGGKCAIVSQGGSEIEFATFGAMIEMLVELLVPLVPCDGLGQDEQRHIPLEMAITGLFPHHQAH